MDHHCEDCVKGYLAEGHPSGHVAQFAGVDTYFSKSLEGAKAAIVVITDVFGLEFNNNKLLADTFTKHTGIPVVVPDLFNHDSIPASLLEAAPEQRQQIFGAWMPKHGPPDSKLPIAKKVITELREKHGIKKIGTTGYCFGGRVVALLAADNTLTDANVIAHPAKLAIPEEIEAIKTPTLWICAEIDQTFPPEVSHATEEVLKKRGMNATFKHYPGTTHGFAARGDPKNEVVQKAMVSATEETVKFFSSQLQ